MTRVTKKLHFYKYQLQFPPKNLIVTNTLHLAYSSVNTINECVNTANFALQDLYKFMSFNTMYNIANLIEKIPDTWTNFSTL